MLVAGELSTWHLKCFNRHFKSERKKQKYLDDFREFLEELAEKGGQKPRFEVDDAENCEPDDKEPPAVRVRLRISPSFQSEQPENTFTEAVSSFCNQILSTLTDRDMKQTIARVTNYGLAGIVPTSRTFRVFYAKVWFGALFKNNIPSLNEIMGPQTEFWSPFFKGVSVGVIVLYDVYRENASLESAEDIALAENLKRMALDIWERLTKFCTFKAKETPEEVKSNTNRLSKELSEELTTFNRIVSTFKRPENSETSTLCIDPDLSTEIMDSTLRMFDITSDLITTNLELLEHFRKVSENFYRNSVECLGFAAVGGGVALGMWYAGGAAANAPIVLIPGLGFGVGIIATGYNYYKASNAKEESKRLQDAADYVFEIYVCCQKIATTLLPVTEIEICNEDEKSPWTEIGPQNDDGNAKPNTSIKSMKDFYVDVHRRKKVFLVGTHREIFSTVLLEEDKQIKKSVKKLAEVDSTFADLRK